LLGIGTLSMLFGLDYLFLFTGYNNQQEVMIKTPFKGSFFSAIRGKL